MHNNNPSCQLSDNLQCDATCSMRYRKILKMYNIKEMLYVSTQRKTLTKVSIYVILLFTIVILSAAPYFWNIRGYSITPRNMKFPTDLKYILFWKAKQKKNFPHTNKEPPFAPGQTLFIKQKCPFINCYITYNRNMLKSDYYYDAIVFDIHDIRRSKPQDFNLTRASYQKYIFRSMHSSETRPICNGFYDNFFNWTWTYKLDSSIPHPFLNIYDMNNTLIGPLINMTWLENMKHIDKFAHKIKHKKKAVACIVGNCKIKTKHKDYLEDLKKELKGYNYTLDTYGSCGDKQCPNGALYKCYKMIEKEYFFQLVLEDSIAGDYVTEKLVKVLQLATVPLVLGGADYRSFLPPGTYINAQAFDLKKLGAILDYLIKKPQTYAYFLDWKNHYVFNVRPRNYVCDLCTKLNEIDVASESKKQFRKWWNPQYEDICTRERLYYKFLKDSSESENLLVKSASVLK